MDSLRKLDVRGTKLTPADRLALRQRASKVELLLD
jgi:hypothetical protein